MAKALVQLFIPITIEVDVPEACLLKSTPISERKEYIFNALQNYGFEKVQKELAGITLADAADSIEDGEVQYKSMFSISDENDEFHDNNEDANIGMILGPRQGPGLILESNPW